MSLYAALILTLSPAGDAPHAACGAAVAVHQAGRGQAGRRQSAPCRERRAHPSDRHAAQSALHAGDPVTLDGAFFLTGAAGGVGRDPYVSAPVRRYAIIASSHGGGAAPLRSAGREAARRGLPRP